MSDLAEQISNKFIHRLVSDRLSSENPPGPHGDGAAQATKQDSTARFFTATGPIWAKSQAQTYERESAEIYWPYPFVRHSSTRARSFVPKKFIFAARQLIRTIPKVCCRLPVGRKKPHAIAGFKTARSAARNLQ